MSDFTTPPRTMAKETTTQKAVEFWAAGAVVTGAFSPATRLATGGTGSMATGSGAAATGAASKDLLLLKGREVTTSDPSEVEGAILPDRVAPFAIASARLDE